LVNHEKRLPVDATCTNLALKYNMLYVSAYQVIRDHLQRNTDLGKKLRKTQKPKPVVQELHGRDEF